MDDKELTSLVLEALSLRVKSQSMDSQVIAIDHDISELKSIQRKFEDAQKQYNNARLGAQNATGQAMRLMPELDRKVKEVQELAERISQLAKQGIANAKSVEKEIDFTPVLTTLIEKTKTAEELKQQMVKIQRELQERKAELKRAGIDVDMAAKTPARIQL